MPFLAHKAMIASMILILSYLFLFTEKLNRAVVVLLGAGTMILFGILTYSEAIRGVDFNTIALLVGMMIIVGITEKSGAFQYAAAFSAQLVKANPRGLLVILGIVTAILSAFLDNVTTVLLIVPVTIEMTRKLKLNAYPFLLMEIFSSNIGGTATLIGDPPNIIIGGALNLGFTDFLAELTPLVIATLAILLLAFDIAYGRHLTASAAAKNEVLAINAADCITNFPLLIKSLIILALTISGFIIGEHWHIENGTIALFGAALLLALYTMGMPHQERDTKTEEAFSLVDWTTIFFFTGLFALVYGLEIAGVLEYLGHQALTMVDGSIKKATYLVLWSSALLSTAIDNIPFVATMIPLLKTMEESLGGREAMMPVWWALSIGSCFGGNGSLIASSANVIVAGIAAREGKAINFIKFLFWSLPIMLSTIFIAHCYLYVRHFM
ncbi:MAG: ArsB/NhaD family transporter [Alphaproteobacteria bacterium]|nr:ArsB/NhaD family transporter [Alphaproteobacteria bacterium]